MTRAEHLDWCKKRALEYCERGEFEEALASMTTDMSQHPETDCPPLLALGLQLYLIVLATRYTRATEGSMRFGSRPVALARLSGEDPFVIIDIVPSTAS